MSSPSRRQFLLRAAFLPAALAAAARSVRAAGLSAWNDEPAPNLVLKDANGGTRDLARYRGKVVLVNFWATWCEPCRHEMPSIQRLRGKLTGKAFDIFMVNVDEPDARVRRFLSETGLDLPVLIDVGKTVTRAWSVSVLPTSFLVGPDGRLRYRVVGDIDWSAPEVVRAVSDLLR